MFGTKVIDCFTTNAMAYKYASIAPAHKFMPDWWRELPKPKNEGFAPQSNMKLCRGFIDHYKNSFIIPMWSDLDIGVGPKGTGGWRYQYADEGSSLVTHDPAQWGGLRDPRDIFHAKLTSPWHIRAKDDTRFIQMAPTYNLPASLRGMEFMPGNIEFKHQTATHMILLFDRPDGDQEIVYKLPLGMPIAHFIPLTEKKVKIKTHLVDEKEMRKIEITRVGFIDSYGKVKKCPFNFG